MNKGFTLIELLAVIVILAIIALIATPIVLSIINDTKESAVIRSAEFYVDAVQNKIMQEKMKLGVTLNPRECIVEEISGDIKCDGETLEIEVNGDKPDGGKITFENGRVTGITLKFEEREVIQNSSGELVLSDNIDVCTLVKGNANEIGSKYECEVKSGTKHNFYVLSHEENGTTNLIMERNICEDGTLATEDNTCLVAWTSREYLEEHALQEDLENYENLNIYGPVTAMNYLSTATSSWNNISNLNMTYDDEGGNFEDFSLTGKARLPYLSEVNSYDRTNGYLYENLSSDYWDHEDGQPTNNIENIFGYWTLSSFVDNSNYAWYVISIGYVDSDYVVNDYDFGVRPVINVKL